MWQYNYPVLADDELMHFGVLGMKWGVRCYQNKDGSLTKLGEQKYTEQALAEVKNDKRYYRQEQSDAYKKLNAIQNRQYNKAMIEIDGKEHAENFIKNYANRKASEMLEQAYKDGSIKAGRDYIVNERQNIVFTESGLSKKKDIQNKATGIARIDNADIVKRFIDGPNQKKAGTQKSLALGQQYGNEIRSKISRGHYKSAAEKKQAIDTAFRQKINEAERKGDNTLANELQQQWAFMYDEIK